MVAKRIIILIGLAGFMMTWTVLAVYGAICFLKKIGWPL